MPHRIAPTGRLIAVFSSLAELDDHELSRVRDVLASLQLAASESSRLDGREFDLASRLLTETPRALGVPQSLHPGGGRQSRRSTITRAHWSLWRSLSFDERARFLSIVGVVRPS